MRVPGLNPNEVTPQRPFTPNDGRILRIDFAIERDDVRIAIEVEGWDKTGSGQGKTKQEHDAFTRRIQSLTSEGWKPLPISNAQFQADKGLYQDQIRQLLVQGRQEPPDSPKAVVSPEGLAEPSAVPKSQAPAVAAEPAMPVDSSPVVHGEFSGRPLRSTARAGWNALAEEAEKFAAVVGGLILVVLAITGVWAFFFSDDSSSDDEIVLVSEAAQPATSTSAPEAPELTPNRPENPGNSRDCGDFGAADDPDAWRAAQAWHDEYFGDFGDVARLDGDGDGIACASLLPDCASFEDREDAQRWFDEVFPQFGDAADLDGDSDGRACE